MNKQELLNKIREERPHQVINDVLMIQYNEYGFYDVDVDMQSQFFETTILHTHVTLPFPLEKYRMLTDEQKSKYNDKHLLKSKINPILANI